MSGPIDDAEAAEKLFGGTVHQGSTFFSTPDLSHSVEETDAANQAWRQSLQNVQLSGSEGEEITNLAKRYAAEPADKETRAGWLKTTSENLERRYGPVEARERLSFAQKLVAKDPTFKKELTESGLASHPRVVELLVERAHSLRLAGKL